MPMQATDYTNLSNSGILEAMKDLIANHKFRQMVFYIMIGILLIGMITLITRMNSETLSDYAEKNPDIAYAETDTSWKDAYTTTVTEPVQEQETASE